MILSKLLMVTEKLLGLRSQIIEKYSEPLKRRIPPVVRRVLDENMIFLGVFTQIGVRFAGYGFNAFALYKTATLDLTKEIAVATPLVNMAGMAMSWGSLMYYGTQRDAVLTDTFNQLKGLYWATLDYYGDKYIEGEERLAECAQECFATTRRISTISGMFRG